MKEKQTYSVWQNICYMVTNAWKHAPSVLWLCFIFAALSLGINVAQLYLPPVVLSKVETLAPLSELLITIGIFTGILVLLNGLLGYVDENTLYGRIEIRSAIIGDIREKACTTSYPNITDPDVQKLKEKAMDACSSNSKPAEHIWETLTLLLLNLSGFVLYLTLLSGLNLFLIAVVLATSCIGFFLSSHMNQWGYLHREEEAKYQRQLLYVQEKSESIALAKDIRIFGLVPWLNSLYQKTLNLYEAFVIRRERRYVWACAADAVLGFLRNGIAYLYLIRLALDGGLSASEFLLYFSAFTGFSAWVTGILQGITDLHRESLDLSSVREYLNLPELFRFEGGRKLPETYAYELKLEHVSFRYPNTENYIIRDMNLTIHPGENIAIVGLNGAGKTTLVKLLCGFYDPDEGRVLLNGTDIREFNRNDYYALFSAVFQEFSELDITVAQTVAQSVSRIDMDRVKECIRKAGMTESVEALPNGYDTHLGKNVYLDGVQLSGGQTQRLMLARALYKDGAILVLDEPTAALDPIAEHDIYMKYNEMTAGKSSVFISHRLASTRFCDRILFLKDGAIAEEGTHEELLARGGGYASLFHIQARYYQEGRDFDEGSLE